MRHVAALTLVTTNDYDYRLVPITVRLVVFSLGHYCTGHVHGLVGLGENPL
jgi:hypothetical protein